MNDQRHVPTALHFSGANGRRYEWTPNGAQTEVAWEVLVNLGTRVPFCQLREHEGSDREALTSLYALFSDLRRLLNAGGSDLAALDNGTISLAGVIATTLNWNLRPFLTRWHPQLLDHEALAPIGHAPISWERSWAEHVQFRRELEELGRWLADLATLCASATGGQDFVDHAL